MPQLPLSELRVVEIGSGDALGYCGKLFSDFGAEVVKIEPSGGDAARKIPPLVDAGGGEAFRSLTRTSRRPAFRRTLSTRCREFATPDHG